MYPGFLVLALLSSTAAGAPGDEKKMLDEFVEKNYLAPHKVYGKQMVDRLKALGKEPKKMPLERDPASGLCHAFKDGLKCCDRDKGAEDWSCKPLAVKKPKVYSEAVDFITASDSCQESAHMKNAVPRYCMEWNGNSYCSFYISELNIDSSGFNAKMKADYWGEVDWSREGFSLKYKGGWYCNPQKITGDESDVDFDFWDIFKIKGSEYLLIKSVYKESFSYEAFRIEKERLIHVSSVCYGGL